GGGIVHVLGNLDGQGHGHEGSGKSAHHNQAHNRHGVGELIQLTGSHNVLHTLQAGTVAELEQEVAQAAGEDGISNEVQSSAQPGGGGAGLGDGQADGQKDGDDGGNPQRVTDGGGRSDEGSLDGADDLRAALAVGVGLFHAADDAVDNGAYLGFGVEQ